MTTCCNSDSITQEHAFADLPAVCEQELSTVLNRLSRESRTHHWRLACIQMYRNFFANLALLLPMPEPRRPNIWTPRQRHTYFPSKLGWMLPPSKPYVVPPPPPASLKSSRFDFFVSADDTTAQASASELKSLADGWLTTAKALKAQIPGAQEPLPAPAHVPLAPPCLVFAEKMSERECVVYWYSI